MGIVGSLRQASFNRGLMRAAQSLAPSGMQIEIGEIPPYNEDVLFASGFPGAVDAFRERVRVSDALLIATPEYNYSVPGVLKNVIDWASRPPDQPFKDKPISLMGATSSLFGTTRAQHHLRQTFVFLDARVLGRPEVMVPMAKDKFSPDGELHDETTRTFIAKHLVALEQWTRRLALAAS
jgi:chromate reductase